ncbi:ATP synthase subunit I [Gammaproteobacteria bacterium]|nr:ATP synthase subunit I [Gammaproteobacteria bacterium]
MSTIKPPPFTRVIVLQFTAAVVIAVLVGVIAGEDKGVIAYSAFLGGLISAIPGAYFAFKMFQHRGASETEKMIASVFKGEAIKLGLMAAGFALTFASVKPLAAVWVFVGFLVVHLAGIYGAYRLTKRQAD